MARRLPWRSYAAAIIVAFLEIGRRVKPTRRSFPTGQLPPYSTTCVEMNPPQLEWSTIQNSKTTSKQAEKEIQK